MGSVAFAQDSINLSNVKVQEGDVVTVYDTVKTTDVLPLSVDVLTREVLEIIRAVHPAEALNQVAGVNIHRGSGQEHLTAIRSPVLTGGAGAGSFLYLQDGVPLRAAGFANVNGLFEAGTEFASSLDVIKGPGPATYGSNAVHGLVNVQSRRAEPMAQSFSIMGSDDGLLSIIGEKGFSTALGSNQSGAFLISGAVVSDNGFRDNSGFDQQKFQLRYDGELGQLWNLQWLTQFQNLNQETAGFIQGNEAYRDDALRFTNPNPEAFRDAKSYRTQARIERDFGDNTVALTPYTRRTELRFLRHFVPGQAHEKSSHSSAGLQTAYFSDINNFNVGVDAEFTSGSIYEFQANPNRFSFVQGLHYDYGVKSAVLAAYAEKRFPLRQDLSLEVGGRAEYTRYNYNNRASTGSSGRFIRAADRKDDFFTLTPKLSLSYQVMSGLQVYARAARGSRAPQVTDLYSAQQNQVPGQADVETLDSLEGGLKFTSATFSADVAAFTMQKNNFFFRNANGFNVVNGKTRHEGIEASFKLPFTDWLSLSGSGTLARHTYDFTEIVGSAANDITKGNRVDTAPDILGHLRMTVNPTDALTTDFEWRHMGRYFTNPGNTAEYPGHDIFILRAAFEVSDSLQVFGRMDNVLDAKYADRADFAFGNERYFPGRPRTLFFGVRQRY